MAKDGWGIAHRHCDAGFRTLALHAESILETRQGESKFRGG